ncbi:MAG TPA: asparagine synthase (glutamine-hydrolyzing) [Acidimicrobiales bacterium]|nr:asparagine synthase (glutamine-hydrolyzing) [Acidimicrobiales bacterium]
MCGIAGWVGCRAGGGAVASVQAALQHRGPDASGIDRWSGDGWDCTLIHTRLAINDLSEAANQPLVNEDDSLALVFNGEIYNSPELRRYCESRGHRFRSHSDGEVIVHLWEDHGLDALSRLNGIFALALLDRRAGRLVLARDPVGVKPLFWTERDGRVWFASELRALQTAGAPVGGPDPTALAQFLTFLWIPDPRTPFTNAHSLLPGEALVWQGGLMEQRMYRSLVVEAAGQATISVTTASSEVAERVQTAVQRQLLSDVPVGLMASGGVDSSLLWWAAEGRLDRAYTIDWSGDRSFERLNEDTAAVGRLEGHFATPVSYVPGTDVDVEELPASGDLLADPAADLARLIASRAAADGFKVLLSGQGGDELFGGYRRHVVGPTAARMRLGRPGEVAASLLARTGAGGTQVEYLARLLRAGAQSDPLSSYMVLSSYSNAPERASVLDCTATEVADEVVWQRHREAFEASPVGWSLLRRLRAVDLTVYLPGLGLAYSDRSGMHHSVEVRVPWLDLDLIGWALTLPGEALVRGRVGKWLTRKVALDVLPAEVVSRPKRGFGAPINVVKKARGSVGSRGFRQGAYFALAEGILRRWLAGQAAA